MAERKLRVDAAASAAVPHPRIRMPGSDDQPVTTDLDPTNLAAAAPELPPFEWSPGESLAELEHVVRQKLISDPEVSISSLVVRQIEGGVCLEGILETPSDLTDVESLVRSVASVDRVLNRLVLRPPDASG